MVSLLMSGKQLEEHSVISNNKMNVNYVAQRVVRKIKE